MYYVGSPNLFEEILPNHIDQTITEQISSASNTRENSYDPWNGL